FQSRGHRSGIWLLVEVVVGRSVYLAVRTTGRAPLHALLRVAALLGTAGAAAQVATPGALVPLGPARLELETRIERVVPAADGAAAALVPLAAAPEPGDE